MRRLTRSQYGNSIEDIFGADARPSSRLPSDRETEQFLSIGSSLSATSSRGVELYRDAALEVATHVVDNKQRYGLLADCSPSSSTDPCITEFIEHFGRLLWRRPLSEVEVARYAAIVGAAGDSAQALELGTRYALAGLLQSPNFLYVPQVGEPAEGTSTHRYTSAEMASRLSYFIWNSTPDGELLAAAEAGRLTDPEHIETQVRRMLHAERGRSLPVRFVAEAWGVDDLKDTGKDPDLFPQWTTDVREAAWGEFRRTLTQMLDERRSLVEVLFAGQQGYANDALAPLYGQSASGPELEPVDRGEHRAGLLTSIAVMAANSPPHRTSPTLRGLFVRANVLCLPVPPPPEDVETELDSNSSNEGDEPESIRERLEKHRSDPTCAGCHKLFDPMGMTLENFDAVGRYRTEANGFPIDPSAEFEGTPLADAVELASFLREDTRVRDCLTKQLYSFATARSAGSDQAAVLDGLTEEFRRRDELFEELVVSIATSRGFRFLSLQESP